MRRLALVLAMALAPAWSLAAHFEGVVTHVTDGDTLTVRPLSGAAPQRIRIQGIDAPEICQSFGVQSRDALASQVMGKRVEVVTKARDDYDRTVARLRLGHQDVGAWMVDHGYAWSYRFHRSAGPYRQQEAQARRERRGLWQSARPLPPREFRERHGSCH
jgi:endonuclease YncB( thermonuclease family)